jgi:hypothetical protein
MDDKSKLPQRQTPSKATRLMQACIGVTIGLVFVFVAGFLLLSVWEIAFGPSRRMSLKGGAAIIFIPIAGAICGTMYSWNFDRRAVAEKFSVYLATPSIIDRTCIAWGVVWTFVVLTLLPLLGPFWRAGRYWDVHRDSIPIVMIWLIPIVGSFACAQLIGWVLKGRK